MREVRGRPTLFVVVRRAASTCASTRKRTRMRVHKVIAAIVFGVGRSSALIGEVEAVGEVGLQCPESTEIDR